jgi:SNF2 family DNA or RNA helicase
MSFFSNFTSSLKTRFGIITVIQSEKTITVDGLRVFHLEADIKTVWKTTKIFNNMFLRSNSNSITFPNFFAIEFLYIVETLYERTKDPKYRNKQYMTLKQLADIRDSLKQKTWLSSIESATAPRLNLHHLDEFYLSPLPYQMDWFNYYSSTVSRYNLSGSLLAAAPGTGKTFMLMATAACLEAEVVIIICPKNALNRVWENSIKTLHKTPHSYWISSDPRPYQGQHYIVAHYEYLEKLLDFAPEIRGKKVFVGLDESHNLNEIVAARTQNFIKLCKDVGASDVVPASGTPFKAMAREAIPIFSVIDPYFVGDAIERYKKIYGSEANVATDILKHRLGFASFKVEKSETNVAKPIMESLGIKMPTGHRFTLEVIADQMRAYIEERNAYYKSVFSERSEYFYAILDKFKAGLRYGEEMDEYNKYRDCLAKVIRAYNQGFLKDYKDEIMFCNAYENRTIRPTLSSVEKPVFNDAKSIVKYVGLKIQGECLGRVIGRARIDCHVELCRYVDYARIIDNSEKKTLIFTSYVEVLPVCQHTLKELGYSPLLVYGKTNNELAHIVERFEKEPEINPLIATFNSLSTAVPLVMADTIIMINVPFRSYIQEQAISRINRLGATTQSYVYTLMLDTGEKPNISTRTVDILKWSQQQVEAITGIKAPFEVTDASADGSVAAIEGYSDTTHNLYETAEDAIYRMCVEHYDEDVSLYHEYKPQATSILHGW